MKTYKKGRPSKRKVSKKNGPSKKNKLRKKNKTKKMKKIKGGSFFSEKCIPLVMDSGNVKRAMQNILCGLEMYINTMKRKTEYSSIPYGENNYVQMDQSIHNKPHIEVVKTEGYPQKYITITDMLYRDKLKNVTANEGATTVHNNGGFTVGVDTNFIGYTKGQAGKKNNENNDTNNTLKSIPTGKKTYYKTTYTRDDDSKPFHNTPIFYYINDSTGFENKKIEIYKKHISTYQNAMQRLTTNSVCNVMLRKIIGKSNIMSLQRTIEIVLHLGHYGDKFVTFPLSLIADDLCVETFNKRYPKNNVPNLERMQVQVNSNPGRYKIINDMVECKGKLYKPNEESNDNNNLNMTIPETSSDNKKTNCVNAVNERYDTSLDFKGLKEGMKKKDLFNIVNKDIDECKGKFINPNKN
jgi:hypothetical protein